jgi:asparagine synthase (glutamine-hydrolysing)
MDRGTQDLEGVCAAMTSTLAHRGPDDFGYWFQRDIGLAMGHRRLSIVDLSPAGHQPMGSASGRYQVTLNGEIYNHLALRTELESNAAAPTWRGHSDTETLLAAIEAWGLRRALQRSVGMFALALWDRQQRRLSLARDRAGEKPLYYGTAGRAFLYGSELKALRTFPDFDAEIDRGCLALFLRHNYVPEPRSIYRGVRRVPAGTILEVDELGRHGEPEPYWTLATWADAAPAGRFAGSDADAVAMLEQLLGEAVRLQMVADVPLGAFLSGGIDSSLIVALMQQRAAGRVRTFTIGFTESDYDESQHARAVAQHLGTEHTELIVTPTEAMRVIPRLATIYDEPFADSSQIPTCLVAQLARQHVTVSLSGDAGDELFGGYNRYTWAKRISDTMSRLGPLRGLAARSIRALSPEGWNRLVGIGIPFVPQRWREARAGDKLHRIADLLECSPAQIYRALISHWSAPAEVVVGGCEPQSQLTELMARSSGRRFEEDMMYWDFLTYLPGDILVKVDRAAMAVSLETRVPMLDHRVIEFAWSLPFTMRVRGAGTGKWLLKELLSRYVPRTLTDRPKTGFGIPIDSWLRGPLRDWAESLLTESRLRREGFLNPTPIRQKWLEHVSGRRNWAYWLWDVIMFQTWLEEQARSPGHGGYDRELIGRTTLSSESIPSRRYGNA